jgi:hypothetical protein
MSLAERRPDLYFEQNEAVKWMCRHLVALVTCYHPVKDGKIAGDEQMIVFPGFVVEFMGEWCWVTAGHNLIDVFEKYVREGVIRINKYSFMDYFGPDATVKQPIYFSFPDEPKWRLDDPDLGIDFAVMHLRPYFVEHFKKSGIIPFTEQNWLPAAHVRYDTYAMLGTPFELMDRISNPNGDATKFGAEIRVVFINVEKADEIPEGSESPPENWFIGKVRTPFNIGGMSGSPIFGFNKNEQGLPVYRVFAVQSRCFHKQGIIYATPIAPVLHALKETFLEAIEAKSTGSQQRSGVMKKGPVGSGLTG